jgi:isopenicillin-N epimerase
METRMENRDAFPYLAVVNPLADSQPPPPPPQPFRPGIAREWMLEEGVDFLNHGSFGAVPRVVFDEQTEWRRRVEARPVETLARRGDELIGAAKQAAGAWLGMRPDDFGLVTNATEGVNAVLRSLTLRPGDELLTTTHVYNAVRQAMKYVGGRAGATYREVEVPLPLFAPGEIVDRVTAAISDRTRLLVIDHVTSPTGLIFPVEPIVRACAARGVDVLVDGAHAPAMLPLDVAAVEAAYYAGNLHKWAFAPRGTAFLWVRPDRQKDVHPTVISHRLGEGLAREFGWQGTRDVTAWLTGPRAIRFLADLGEQRVREHNHALAAWAHRLLCTRWGIAPLTPADGSMLGSMATVALPRPFQEMSEPDSQTLQRRLYTDHRFEVPVHRFAGRWVLRVSCQVYNTAAQYERLAEVVGSLSHR